MTDAAMDADLHRMCQMFEESESATRDARQLAERDRDYYDEKQWTSTEKAALENRGQPANTYNRIKRKVNSLTGLEKQTRKDPKAFPRNPQDEESAHAATDAIRYVCDDCRWDDKRSGAAENLIIEGTGAIMVGVKQTKAGLDPELRRIPFDRLFWDPHSSEFDFSDAAYMGIVIWSDLDDAKAKYGDKGDALDATWNDGKGTETYDDKPKFHLWSDYKRKRIRIVEMYYKKGGEWYLCIFTKRGFLVDPMPSPYLDEDGQPENPIKAVSLYIDRDNNRYGEVRTMISPQDDFNKRRSKALHLISQRQIRVSPSVGTDAEVIRKELSRPDGVFVGEQGEVEVLQTNDMATGNLNMMQLAGAELDLLGPNAALQGKNEQEMSGKAIIAQQQGGMLEAATLMDRIRVLSFAVYRAIWCRIRQNWTQERWIRVTDSDKNIKFVGLNRQVTGLEAMANKLGITQENFQQFQQENPQQVQQFMMFAQSPMAQQVQEIENNVAELDVDITIDEGMDTPTIAAEQFQDIVKLVSTGMVKMPADVLIEASSLRNKEKLLERMREPEPSPEQQQIQQLQQRGMMAEVAGAEADVDKTKADTALALAKAGSEHVKPLEVGFRTGLAA